MKKFLQLTWRWIICYAYSSDCFRHNIPCDRDYGREYDECPKCHQEHLERMARKHATI